jgi:hypothetical protein
MFPSLCEGREIHFGFLRKSSPQLLDNPKSKSLYDRRSVGQLVLLSGHHPGPVTNSFTSMENIFRHLRFSSCGAPSLTRRRVSNLSIQLLLGLASAIES